MILVHSKNDKAMRIHFEQLVSMYGGKLLIPGFIEDKIFLRARVFFFFTGRAGHAVCTNEGVCRQKPML